MKVYLQEKEDFIFSLENSLSKVTPAPFHFANQVSRKSISPLPNFLSAGPRLKSHDLEINLSRLKAKKSRKQPLSRHSFFAYTYYWLLEELSFTMNKISLAGLIFGLMVLGSLFFVIGFLAAVATFGTGGASTPPSWANINQADSASQSAFGKIAGAVGGKLVHDQAIKLESKVGGGALAKVVQTVPPSLQPFAAQAQNHLALKAQQGVGGFAATVQGGGFGPRRFGSAQHGQAPAYHQPNPASTIPQRKAAPAFAPHPQQQQQYAGQPLYRLSPQQPGAQGQQPQQMPPQAVLRPVPQQQGYQRPMDQQYPQQQAYSRQN